MPRFFTLVFAFLLSGNIAFATIDISLTNPASQTLLVSYKANSAYSAAPFNIWNSQVFTLRWSTALGAAVITGIQNQSAFTFALDGAAVNGNDGFFYQKFTSAATNVNQSIANGATLPVITISLLNAGICGGDFELITGTSFVNSIFGTASANNVLGEQFGTFAPPKVENVLLNPSATLQTWFADTDQDGNGDPNNTVQKCDQPAGFVANSNDCNDSNPNLPTTPGTACNDGNAQTINDVIKADGCTCAGTLVDCPGLGLNFGDPCNDNDPCTINDEVQTDCTCKGTFQDDDGDGTCNTNDLCPGGPEPGSPCNDTDPTTGNDQINANCLCVGTPTNCTGIGDADGDGVCTNVDCNDNDPQATGNIGAPCNDNDPCTVNDVVTAGCGCAGTFQDSDNDGVCNANDPCPNGPNPGSPCNDGDPTTANDVIISNCICAGTPTNCTGIGDGDGDGVCTGVDCNDNDPQATGIIGAPCNDNDPCTVNDVVTAGCGCAGTFQDSDNDGICNANDVCPNGPNPGSPCDDNNPNTMGTIIQSNCTCGGGNTVTLTLTCPSNISVTAQSGQTSATVTYNTPTENSNCPVGSVTTTLSSGLPSGAAFPLGTSTVSYMATDGCGNSQNCSFQVTVNSGQGGIDCSNVTITGGSNFIKIEGLTAPVNEVQVFTGNWSATVLNCFGNCSVPTQQVFNLAAGTYHVIVKFYSASYQFICEKNQDVVVGGSGGNVLNLTCPANITVTAASGQTSAVVNYNPPVSSTTCPGGNVALQQTGGLQSGAAFPLGTTTVAYSATDNCGNAQSCSFSVTVNAGQGGGVDCNNVTVTNGGGVITVAGLTAPINEVQVYTNDWSATVYFCFMNCSVPTQVLPNLANGTYHVIVKFYTANYQPICEKTQDIVVGGGTTTNLTLTCPSNITMTVPAGQSSAAVTYSNPVATSTCPTGSVSVFRLSGPVSGAVFPLGTTTVTYQATDGCGNVENCSFQVTINQSQGNADCDNLQFDVNDDSIIVSGLVAPINEIQVIKGDWSSQVFTCFGNCDSPVQVISMLDPGIYHLIVKFYSASYQLVCEKLQDVVISSGATHLIVLDFNAIMNEETHVGLYWVNNTQVFNDYFVVEKSLNGIDFEPLIQLDGSGDIDKLRLYRDIDRNPVEGDNYYRLKLVYKDGSYSYSEVRKVVFTPESNFTIFPNPAGEQVTVYMDKFIGKEVDLIIVNPLGKTVFKEHFSPVKDKLFPIELDRDRFIDGIYPVSVVHRGKVYSKRLVVSRF